MSAFASNSRDITSSARLPVSRNSCGKEGAMSLSGGLIQDFEWGRALSFWLGGMWCGALILGGGLWWCVWFERGTKSQLPSLVTSSLKPLSALQKIL